jgi:hypothetical protein
LILKSAEKEPNPNEERWMWIDEYESKEDYDKMYKAIENDREVNKLKKKWDSLWNPMIVPGSRRSELWTEMVKVELRK